MNAPSPEVIRKVPAARALAWVAGCWALILSQPLRLLLIGLFFQFLVGFFQANALGVLVVMCLPVLSAGVLHAFFLVESGQRPMLAVLFAGFTSGISLGRLVTLGGLAGIAGLAVFYVVLSGQLADIDPDIVARVESGDFQALQLIDPRVFESALMALIVAGAVRSCLTYFAAPLIWFGKRGVTASIVTGLRALGTNWRPLLLIGLLLGLMAVPIGLLFGYFYLSALQGAAVSTWLALLLMLLGPLFQLIVYGIQYFAFRDIFGFQGGVETRPPDSGDQLVA